jgi:hypothetical protein
VKLNGTAAAILFGVWATFALDVYSTLNSSPQTTELFAGDRAESLMHWVVFGDVVAVAGGLTWTLLSKEPWPLIATLIVAGGMHASYSHAIKRGTGKPAPAGSDRGGY